VTALVATEIAARGLDIKELPQVVNYELPQVPEDYVHRIGRTARAGSTGRAVSLVSPDETPLLRDIERLLRRSLPVAALPAFKVPPPSQEEPGREAPRSGQQPPRDRRPQPSRDRPPSRERAHAPRERRYGNGRGR
jgi:ATP-dependent RNA helicase RhlE